MKVKMEQLKELRKKLKEAVSSLETKLLLASLGVKIGVNEQDFKEETKEGRQTLREEIQSSIAEIQDCLEEYERLADEAIKSMS